MPIDLGDGVIFHPRSEWADAKYPGEVDLPAFVHRGTPRALVDIYEYLVHHSGGLQLGDPDPRQWIRNIYNHHVHVLGYVAEAYEAFVDERGHLWEGRPALIASGATLGHNLHGYATCLLRAQGDVEGGGVPIQVQRAFRKNFQITDYLVRAAGGRGLTENTHRRTSATACPGDDLDGWVMNEHGLHVPFSSSPVLPPPVPMPRPRPQKFPPYPGVAIRNGSRGTQVRQWQERLHFLGIDPGPRDGVFGRKTEEATKVFQALRRLRVDGIVGPQTWGEALIDRR